MITVADFYKKYERYFLVGLLVMATLVLCIQITAPFIDYDEATYAKVIVDTMRSGDATTFTLSGHPWFEKPPLYLWTVIASVKAFGVHEWAFRLPSVIFSVLCLLLVYMITRVLTASPITSAGALVLLLSTPDFYHLGNQVRLDSAVLAAMLVALYLCIKGWREEKYLLGIFPAIAVGFLFKSFIAVLIIPVLLIYSFFYSEWSWITNRSLWYGSLIALVIWIPWHLMETLRFGATFWDNYFLRQVLERSTSTLTGQGNYYDYVYWLWSFEPLWSLMILVMFAVFLLLLLLKRMRSSRSWKYIAAPVFSALFLFIFFTLLRTHLSPYILPVFPFLAMFVALVCMYARSVIIDLAPIPVIVLIIIGISYSFLPINAKVMPSEYEEAYIGQVYKTHSLDKPAPLYAADWAALETLNYYGDTSVKYFLLGEGAGKILHGPLYIVAPLGDNWPLFYDTITGKPVGGPTSPNEVYVGRVLVLLYSEHDVRTAR